MRDISDFIENETKEYKKNWRGKMNEKEMEIKSRIRIELGLIDKEYRIYRYSYKTLLISTILLCIATFATYFELMSFITLMIGWIVLSPIIILSGLTSLKYYNRIHDDEITNIKQCSRPQLHNFPDRNSPDTKCLDCGKTFRQIYNEYMQYINDEGIMFIPPLDGKDQKIKED